MMKYEIFLSRDVAIYPMSLIPGLPTYRDFGHVLRAKRVTCVTILPHRGKRKGAHKPGRRIYSRRCLQSFRNYERIAKPQSPPATMTNTRRQK